MHLTRADAAKLGKDFEDQGIRVLVRNHAFSEHLRVQGNGSAVVAAQGMTPYHGVPHRNRRRFGLVEDKRSVGDVAGDEEGGESEDPGIARGVVGEARGYEKGMDLLEMVDSPAFSEQGEEKMSLKGRSGGSSSGRSAIGRRRITTESVVDAAASEAERPAEAGLTPVSVPRLEQALHAVNSLAADLRLGPGGAAVSSPSSSPSAVTSQAEKAD
ncbi:hypothetical protein B296_00010799 [Ensete ventricosum]|uniref:Uncharacterized protein n=1 Tax=Ensete ventricosum TaxID=4639 RepID=A0A427AQH0_ENSVE|nr:hypothetical protein B296_00010799 [Ensete ventricosum]